MSISYSFSSLQRLVLQCNLSESLAVQPDKKKNMQQSSYYRSSVELDTGCSKKEFVGSVVRDLPPVEVVFPFLHFQPQFDASAIQKAVQDSSSSAELISSLLAQDSCEVRKDWFNFPISSPNEWIWLGEDGFDDDPPLEPVSGVFHSDPIDFEVPVSNCCSEDSKKKVRFVDHRFSQVKKKAELEYSRYEQSRKVELNDPAIQMSLPVPTQKSQGVVLSSRDESARASKLSDRQDREKPNQTGPVECIRFDTAADIQAFVSEVSKEDSTSTASSGSNKEQSTSQRRYSSGRGDAAYSTLEEAPNDLEKFSSPRRRIENHDIRQVWAVKKCNPATSKNSIIRPHSSEESTSSYDRGSLSKGEKKNESSGVLSKSKVPESKAGDQVQPRRSARIKLRQSKGKQNNWSVLLWMEPECR